MFLYIIDINLLYFVCKYRDGNTNKFAYYKFTVPNNTEASITYTAPAEEGLYLALHSSTKQISAKLTVPRASAIIEKTLEAGEYVFLIKKYGNTTEGINLKITLASNDAGGEENTNTALTRAELDALIIALHKHPSKENANKISKANVSEITDMSNLFSGRHGFDVDISKWDVSNVQNNNNFAIYSALSDTNNPFKK